jgi:hypothetical protein
MIKGSNDDVMKKPYFVLITILILISPMATSLQVVNSLNSNYFVTAPALEIINPTNTTYSGKWAQAVPFSIYSNVLTDAPAVVSISYSLDEDANITFTNLGKTGEFPSESGRAIAYHIEFSLNNLTDGSHTLKAYSYDVNSNEMSDSVEFTVSSGITPTPSIRVFMVDDFTPIHLHTVNCSHS